MSIRPILCALLAIALASLAAAPVLAADPTGYRGDLLADLGQLENKIVGLAEAFPAEKYTWRPAEGVRSVSEAIMHMASANFFFPTLVGQKPPEGIEIGALEKITEKDKVIETLKKSFESVKGMVQGVPDEKLGETMNMFGRDTTYAGALHAAASHCHEHLGQVIAYARANGIAPPWSN